MVEAQRRNWVEERAECAIKSVFERIEKEVQFDVAALEEHKDRTGHGHCSFTMETQATVFTVISESGGSGMGFSVQFNMNRANKSIVVHVSKSGGRVEEHMIRSDWNNEQDQCNLLLDGEPLAAWEISRAILGPLLFE